MVTVMFTVVLVLLLIL